MHRDKKKMKNYQQIATEEYLNENEKAKCYEKFESFKALGSLMLSKN